VATIKRLDRYVRPAPPQQASLELRAWLDEEFERLQLVINGIQELVDELRAVPAMYLVGTATDFLLSPITEKIVGYSTAYATGEVPTEPDPVSGTITIPRDGVYTLTARVTGVQGSPSQNESITLLVDVDGVRAPIDVVDVASVQTADRALGAVVTRGFTAGEVVSLWMEATDNLGIFDVASTTFELVQTDI
jgi:hypothetical protein